MSFASKSSEYRPRGYRPRGGRSPIAPVQPQPRYTSMITNPEGNERGSTIHLTPGMLAPTIADPEENETESPFYDAVENLGELSATMLVAEQKKTESAPTQCTVSGASADQTFHENKYADKLGCQPHGFGRDGVIGGKVHQMQAKAEVSEAPSIIIKPGSMETTLLNINRFLIHHQLSPSTNHSLAMKGITRLKPLQEEMVELLVDLPKGCYVERCKAPHSNQKVMQFVGAQKPTHLKEGETANRRGLHVKARQHVVCLADIDSDKTLSYLLPLYEHLLVRYKTATKVQLPHHPSERNKEFIRSPTKTALALPFALILVPTRELAVQVYLEMVNLSRRTCIQPAALYCGDLYEDQTPVSVLATGCDILVGTPHRVRDSLHSRYTEGVKALSLECLSHMIWDEADELLSKFFTKEIDDILGMCPRPEDLHHWFLSTQYEKEHVEKAKSLMSCRHAHVVVKLPDENTAMRYPPVEQRFVKTGEDQAQRFNTLKGILRTTNNTKTIIFCCTPASVEWLHNALLNVNIASCSTHEAYSQEHREDAMRSFKYDCVPILVGTIGIGSRCQSFQGVDCLIFWELPETTDQYRWCLSRVRCSGNYAKAFVLFPKGPRSAEDEKYAEFLKVNCADF